METEKNINVTLKQPENNSKEVVLSASTFFAQIKKYVFIWLLIAVVVGLFTVSGVMLVKTNISAGNITALVNFNYDGIKSGLDPMGNKFDVNKIKSPTVIESALTNMDIPLDKVEKLRSNIYIKGIIPNEAMDKISLYQKVFKSGGDAALDAVNSLLEIGYYPSYYIVSLDYIKSEVNFSEGKQILDEILNCYQEYFFKSYGYNEALGNAVVAVDYKDYDYPEAIDVLNSSLESLSTYIKKLKQNENTNYRSNATGYSFDDLIGTIDTLKNTDLDALSSYITINNVTNDKNLLLTYYQYKIEELQRNQKVAESELASITSSIDNYVKDSLLVFGNGAENSETTYSQASVKYDQLINQKLEALNTVSKSKQNISYYNDRIKALKNNTASSAANIEYVEEKLEQLNVKISDLIDTVNKTADEYYETVTFADSYNILVPSTGIEPKAVTGDFINPLLIAEVLVFVIYILVAVKKAFVLDYKEKNIKD